MLPLGEAEREGVGEVFCGEARCGEALGTFKPLSSSSLTPGEKNRLHMRNILNLAVVHQNLWEGQYKFNKRSFGVQTF